MVVYGGIWWCMVVYGCIWWYMSDVTHGTFTGDNDTEHHWYLQVDGYNIGWWVMGSEPGIYGIGFYNTLYSRYFLSWQNSVANSEVVPKTGMLEQFSDGRMTKNHPHPFSLLTTCWIGQEGQIATLCPEQHASIVVE